jgi:arginase family enzyme
MAGAVRARGEMGLAYFDRDAELNTPQSTPSGILDGMVIASLDQKQFLARRAVITAGSPPEACGSRPCP